jgi:hypothetical protein
LASLFNIIKVSSLTAIFFIQMQPPLPLQGGDASAHKARFSKMLLKNGKSSKARVKKLNVVVNHPSLEGRS